MPKNTNVGAIVKATVIFIGVLIPLILMPLVFVGVFSMMVYRGDWDTFGGILLYVGGIAGVFTMLYFLLKEPKTAPATKAIVSVIAVLALVGSCVMSPSGCTESRYVQCDR